MRVKVGTRQQLQEKGCLTAKAGNQPICVLWDGERAYALDDRCPHMGFPLHRGTVESGLVTCHWHHARFDLESGGTLDPFADDVRAYAVEVEGDDLVVVVEAAPEPIDHHRAKLEDGLEQGLTLVTAKAVLGLLEGGTDPAEVVRIGVEWGCRYRGPGWGAGLTIDFTNKAFEAVELLGAESAPAVLPTLVSQTASARRHEEEGEWRHPHDLAGLLRAAAERLPGLPASGEQAAGAGSFGDEAVESLAWQVLADDPGQVVAVLDRALTDGATAEQLGRAVAYAGALRIVRFHTQNDHGDWDVVHHGFTAANALHHVLVRSPSPEALRGVYQLALRVYLDRFLNVPAARLPAAPPPSPPEAPAGALHGLETCWDEQGRVDEAGAIAYHHVRSGGDQGALVAALGRALLAEDAQFHWFQTYEAAVRQARQWPAGSEPAALILAGATRFLAAHTPTRRELAQVVRIATRLRRGEVLFEESGEAVDR